MATAAEVSEVNFYWAPLVKRSKSDTRNFRYLQEIKQNDRGSEIKLKFLVAAPDFSGGGLQPGSKGKGDGWEKSGKPKRNRASHKRWMVGKWGKWRKAKGKHLPTTDYEKLWTGTGHAARKCLGQKSTSTNAPRQPKNKKCEKFKDDWAREKMKIEWPRSVGFFIVDPGRGRVPVSSSFPFALPAL